MRERKNLKQTAENALKQIEEKNYEADLLAASPCTRRLFLVRSIDVISGSIHVQNGKTTKIMVW